MAESEEIQQRATRGERIDERRLRSRPDDVAEGLVLVDHDDDMTRRGKMRREA